MKFSRITVSAEQMTGVPCIRRLRIPVATVVGMISDGLSTAEILNFYPDLEPEDIHESFKYAAEACILDIPRQHAACESLYSARIHTWGS